MASDNEEIAALRAENDALKAELKRTKDRWERELLIAKATLMTVQEELDATREHLRKAMLRTLAADDEVFDVRQDAVAALGARRAAGETAHE